MAIVFNEKKRTFSLHTAKTTYQLKIGNLNYVKHLYYGTTIEDEDLIYLIRRYDRGFSGNPYDSSRRNSQRSSRATSESTPSKSRTVTEASLSTEDMYLTKCTADRSR